MKQLRSVKNIFILALIIFTVSISSLILLSAAEKYLPPNQVTHECKPPDTIVFNSTSKSSNYDHAFCQPNYHAEFKDSLASDARNVTIPIIILSISLLIPFGSVLVHRRLVSKKRPFKL